MLKIENKQIFITGGAGFIGSKLVGRLVEQNKIVIYDNFRRNSLKQNSFATHPNLTVIDGDILDYPKLHQAITGSHIVVHCAAVGLRFKV